MNVSSKERHNKDRNGRDLTEAEDIKKEVARIHRRTVQKRSS